MKGIGKVGSSSVGFFLTDELARGNSFIHRLHPLAKVLTTLVFIVVVISSPRADPAALCIYFFYIALAAASAGVPFEIFFKRVLPVLPFVLFAGLSNILFLRETFAVIGALRISEGVFTCAVLLIKTILTVSAVVLLASTTPATDIFGSLRRLGLPRVLVTVCMLCFRYIALLLKEAGSMTRAYQLRAGDTRGVDLRHMGPFVGQLLLRSIDRAERVYAAMRCRGFDGDFYSGAPRRFGRKNILYTVLLCGIFVAMRLVDLGAIYASLF